MNSPYSDGVMRQFHSLTKEKDFKMLDWHERDCLICQVLVADYTALVAEKTNNLLLKVRKFEQFCVKRKLLSTVIKTIFLW